MITRRCEWPGCKVNVTRQLWGCHIHWRLLPGYLRRKLYRADIHRRKDGDESRLYCEALDAEVTSWIGDYLTGRRYESERRNTPVENMELG